MGLFTSDETLVEEQRAAARIPKGMTLSLEQQRAELMEQQREIREHRRWRQFAFLLFIAPILIAVCTALAQWIVAKVLVVPAP